jgi:hypothetical protein
MPSHFHCRMGYLEPMGAIASNAAENPPGPWNPGLKSHIPKEWRELETIFRPENNFSTLAAAEELRGLTGFGLSDLAIFRPERLALHELLIRVTADFSVPDGSRVGDLGINFRRIAQRILTNYVEPEMRAIAEVFEEARREVAAAIDAALTDVLRGPNPAVAAAPGKRRLVFWRSRRPAGSPTSSAEFSWDASHIAECERRAHEAPEPLRRLAYGTLSKVLSALFTNHGCAWGTRDLIVTLARDLAGNAYGSDAVGRSIDPLLRRAAAIEGYGLLPRQEHPVVINTKGASASGKSTLRLLQKKLAGGVEWSDFALISPDIWRKQLLDYGALGEAYKYAGAFTAEELQIVDRKLDRYMAQKYAAGNMSHLLIDRFRFDSFAPDSDEEGSNLLTRFGQSVFLFFMITPPEQLVERAWKRGLEFGRYKAVDDTLAHAVDAYTGIPNVFFTWVRRSDKRIRFEFLDNSVALGERPRTAVFGDNDSVHILDVKKMIDIDRYGRVFVDASSPDELYRDPRALAAERNVGFLRRCVDGFRFANFASQRTGRIYLRIESGVPAWLDPEALQAALADPDTHAGLNAVAPAALEGRVRAADGPRYLRPYDASCARSEEFSAAPRGAVMLPTLGVWGKGPTEVAIR